jgi:hypothetical protein
VLAGEVAAGLVGERKLGVARHATDVTEKTEMTEISVISRDRPRPSSYHY